MAVFRVLHRWIGLSVVPIFFVTCLTGLALVYQKGIVRQMVTPDAVLPDQYGVQQVGAELEQLMAMPQFHSDALIKAPNAEEPYWWIRRPGGDKQLFRIGDLQQYEQGVWILPVLEFARHLHIELLSGLVGEVLLLYVGLMTLLLGFTGIWLWWPQRRGFHWRWVIPPRRRLKLKSFLRLHSQSGIVLLPMFFVVPLTASVMMFQKVRNALTAAPVVATEMVDYAEVSNGQIAAALKLSVDSIENSWPTYIRLLPGDVPTAKFRLRLEDEWHPNGRTNIVVDLGAMAITDLQDVRQARPLKQVLNQMYPLHSSYGMPLFYSILTALVGVGSLWLLVTGTGSWLRVNLRQNQFQRSKLQLAEKTG